VAATAKPKIFARNALFPDFLNEWRTDHVSDVFQMQETDFQ
jgi:hypothetical protein